MVTFKIVEPKYNFWDKKPDFIELYNKGVTCKQIKNLLQINSAAYSKLLKECHNEKSIKRRMKKTKSKKTKIRTVKHYTYNRRDKKYNVMYKNRFFASFNNEKDAQKFVEIMKTELNWDYEKRWDLKNQILHKGGK